MFEIRTVNLTVTGLAVYRRESQRDTYVAARAAFADTVLGHWTTEGHGVNQGVQLVQYGKTTTSLPVIKRHHRHHHKLSLVIIIINYWSLSLCASRFGTLVRLTDLENTFGWVRLR